MAFYLDTSCLLKVFFPEPTLDRLHLSTMHALGVWRLLTDDDTQAAAARALGMDVLLPR
jgi:hypothetical protein